MDRIFHSYEKWEDYPAGFYDNLSGKDKSEMINKVIELFCSERLTRIYMDMVIEDWPFSCEHNLTNPSLNRVAYLGQAACCIYGKVPSTITMEAWNNVPKQNRDKADEIAQEILNKYYAKNSIKQ